MNKYVLWFVEGTDKGGWGNKLINLGTISVENSNEEVIEKTVDNFLRTKYPNLISPFIEIFLDDDIPSYASYRINYTEEENGLEIFLDCVESSVQNLYEELALNYKLEHR